MTIAILLLVAQLRFPIGGLPSDSWESGHYFPVFMSTFETAFAAELTCDLIWGIPKNIPSALLRSGVCAGVGVLGGSIAYEILHDHYQTAEERWWAQIGASHAIIATFGVSVPMFYYKRAVERRTATIYRMRELTVDMIQDTLPDGRLFWRSKTLVEEK